MNIFVGNLSFSTTEDAVRALFEPHGEISAVRVIKDRESGASRGFAFVEMANAEEAKAAMAATNGGELDGRSIRVSEARENQGDRGGGGRDGGSRERRW